MIIPKEIYTHARTPRPSHARTHTQARTHARTHTHTHTHTHKLSIKTENLKDTSVKGGDVPRSQYGISQLCSNIGDYSNSNQILTAKLLKQGRAIDIMNFVKQFLNSTFKIIKYNVALKTLLQQCISEPVFYGDLFYKFKRIIGKPYFHN